MRYEWDEGLEILYSAAQRASHSSYIYSVISAYLSGVNCDEELIQEVLDYAEQYGYTIDYTWLSDVDKELYNESKEEYLLGLEGEEAGSDETEESEDSESADDTAEESDES